MADTQVAMTADQLQKMLEAVVTKMKEPTEAEKAKMEKEHAETVRRAKEMADLAKVQEQTKKNRWYGCPHAEVFNGRKYNKWVGQVNSNGMVSPVCNICHVEAPPFSATLLPDGGKQGVNFEQWHDASVQQLTTLHKQSFPKGCDRADCFVCKKVA